MAAHPELRTTETRLDINQRRLEEYLRSAHGTLNLLFPGFIEDAQAREQFRRLVDERFKFYLANPHLVDGRGIEHYAVCDATFQYFSKRDFPQKEGHA